MSRFIALISILTAFAAEAGWREVVTTNFVGSYNYTYTLDVDNYHHWDVGENKNAEVWTDANDKWYFEVWDNNDNYSEFNELVNPNNPTNEMFKCGIYSWIIELPGWRLYQYEIIRETVYTSDPIHADYARLFCGGGEWVPDYVPDEAIYDQASPEGKWLRVSSNLQAAAVSCISGLSERYWNASALGGYVYEEYLNNNTYGDRKGLTNDLWSYVNGSENPRWTYLEVGTNRAINTRRWTIWPQLSAVRDEILTTVPRGEFGLNTFWGSSQFMRNATNDVDFPTFDWLGLNAVEPTNLLQTIHPIEDWRWVWPEFDSVDPDGIWRTADMRTWKDGLISALAFFNYENDAYMGEIGGTPAPTTCYGILSNRFGSAAANITSNTQRITYYGLGTIEAAVASMDQTYQQFKPHQEQWNMYNLTYSHTLSARGDAQVNIKLNSDGTASWDPPTYNWSYSNIWSTTTNNCHTYDEPQYVLVSDNITSAGSVGANLLDTSVGCSYEDLIQYKLTYPDIDYVDIEYFDNLTTYWYLIFHANKIVNYGSIVGEKKYYFEATNYTAKVTSSLMANRNANVVIPSPTSTTWLDYYDWEKAQLSYYRPKVKLYAMEKYLFSTNLHYSEDAGGRSYHLDWGYQNYVGHTSSYLEDPDHTVDTDFRSVLLGTFDSASMLQSQWKAAARTLRNTVGQRAAADPRGCIVNDRASVVPLDNAVLNSFQEEITSITNATVSFTKSWWETATVYYEESNEDSSIVCRVYLIAYDSLGHITNSTNIYLHAGEMFEVARYTITPQTFTPTNEIDVVTHDPFHAAGKISPATKVNWTFQNLYTGERIR